MVLTEEQKVVVCSPVKNPRSPRDESNTLLLPWIPRQGPQYHLLVEGGNGERAKDYLWLSSNADTESSNALGVVTAQGLGKALVRVTHGRDPLDYDEVIKDVSIPAFINIVSGLPAEVEVPGSFPVGATLLNPRGKRYSPCDSFSPLIQWGISGEENSFAQVNKTSKLLAKYS